MRRRLRLIALVFIALIFSCDLDAWGWLWSSDVDDRFRENQDLAPVADFPLAPPFSFIVIADTHVFSGVDTASVFAQIQALLVPGPTGDRFVLVCGDLVQNGARSDVETFAAQSAGMGLPVYPVIGNHDLYNGGWAHFRDVLGRSLYTFAAGPVRLVAIDSANGTLGGLQRAWLEGALAARTEPYCVTFTHMEFFADSITETQQWADIVEAYSLMHLFETSDVDIHFSGHTHRRLERTINGTAYVTVPDFRHGFMRVLVTGAGISCQFVDL